MSPPFTRTTPLPSGHRGVEPAPKPASAPLQLRYTTLQQGASFGSAS